MASGGVLGRWGVFGDLDHHGRDLPAEQFVGLGEAVGDQVDGETLRVGGGDQLRVVANLGVVVSEGEAALVPVGADQVCQGVGVQLATELVTRQVTYQSDQ